MNYTNYDRFAAIYVTALTDAMEARPSDYAKRPGETWSDQARWTVGKMMPALARRTAIISPVVRSVARSLGIKPTATAIADWLEGKP